MQTKYLCVCIHMRTKGEVGVVGPPVGCFTDGSGAVLLLLIICVIYVMCLSCFRVCSALLPCGHLLGKD